MGKRLAALPDATLERAARDSRLSAAARRAAERELAQRNRKGDHCPRGAGCIQFDCPKEH